MQELWGGGGQLALMHNVFITSCKVCYTYEAMAMLVYRKVTGRLV